jgi:hypothetical protein
MEPFVDQTLVGPAIVDVALGYQRLGHDAWRAFRANRSMLIGN